MHFKINYLDKFWKLIHFRNLVIAVCVGIGLLFLNEHYFHLGKLFDEFIIVFIAAFTVSAYFEFFLRKGISEENMKLYEMKEEMGKAGIIRYIPNFKDLDLRNLFRDDIKHIDIYVHFADTVLNQVSDEIYRFCKKKGNCLNIYMLSPENKFILGLGEHWGSAEPKYNEAGIKAKIESAQGTLKVIFDRLVKEGTLNSDICVYLLKRHPVFYSFYRFNDFIVYVPSKIATTRMIVPPAFLTKNTHSDTGLYAKCMNELEHIKNEEGALEVFYKN